MSENFLPPFESMVEAARSGDEQAFRALVEPLGRELHAYAYRMLGGFRAWMYRIVTNTCLDVLKTRARRMMPQDVCPPVAA